MVSSVSNRPTQPVSRHQNNQDALVQRKTQERIQDEDLQIRRQDENRQQQIRVEQNREDAANRAGRTIDVIV